MLGNPALPRTAPTPVAIPVRDWLPWLIFAGTVMLFLVYIVGCEQGATSIVGGHYIHEWMHDSRHLLGFPCH
jgi:Probable cobalt transporter subunit (CbtB)